MTDLSEDRGPLVIRTEVVLATIELVAVGLRFWSRRLIRAPLWWDDWFCLFLVFTTVPYNIFNCLLVTAGQGRHGAALADHGAKAYRWVYGDTLWYAFNLAMFKYGILLLYIRIFPQRWLRPFVTTLAVAIAVWLVIIELIFIFQCKPIRAAWDVSALPTANCISFVHVGQSAPTVFFDLIILSLPPILIWRVRIPAIDKTSVVAAFLLCGLVTGASIVRLVLIVRVNPNEPDPSWSFTTLGIWSTVEPSLGLVCSCIPTYGVLVKAAKRKITGNGSRKATDLSSNNISGHASNKARKLSPVTFELLSQGTDTKGHSVGDVSSLPIQSTDDVHPASDGQGHSFSRPEYFHPQARGTQAEQQFV